MDAAVFAQRTGAVLLGSHSTVNIGLGSKEPLPRMEEVHRAEVRTYGQFTITFIESKHSEPDRSAGSIDKVLKPPKFVRAWNTGTTWSMLIQHGQRSALVHGSANFIQGALKDTRADVVYLGIGGLGKKDDAFVEEYWQEVVRATRATRVILVHWDDFFRPLSEPLRPMVGPLDSFADSMRRLLQCGATDGVEVLLPVAWQVTDPFAGLTVRPPERTAAAPHPCRAQ
jgi:L-ascorbate metabolism protein UlaG (beta-lactamase superfamily)